MIVSPPKKMKTICDEIRSGNIDSGINQLNKIPGYIPQKNAILAEIAYFDSRYDDGMLLDEEVFYHFDEWYGTNISKEHIGAYTYASIYSDNIDKGAYFLRKFWEQVFNGNEPDHIKQYYAVQIAKALDLLSGDSEKIKNVILKDAYVEPDTPLAYEVIFKERQLETKKMSETLQPDFILRVLDSIYRKGHPEDYVAYFEETKEKIKGHGLAFIRAAKIYHYLDNADCIEKVETSLIDYARIGWVPINHTMVTPMTLFCYPVLFSYYSIPLLKRILHSEKSCF